ncbi:Hypothetical predicted protein [Olea europaea subsp. europaea]|uniref:Uncharacterized protein n=1 Tax=Olea europaea subsp. europaea TaxID=158383 RepID=A0A8S0PFV7_OLEEU|nr:Hypothetical predicted protein [Olea europaea subsp. europaea]
MMMNQNYVKGITRLLPSLPMHPSSFSCEDLKGIGFLNTTCELSYSLNIKHDVYIEAGSIYIVARNASLFRDSLINVTALAGEPPEDSTRTPKAVHGGGGEHGGRGAGCVMDSEKLPEDVWGWGYVFLGIPVVNKELWE